MKPSQVAARLRRIASYIENTHKPSQATVSGRIASVLRSIRTASVPSMKKVAAPQGTFEVILDLINEDQFEAAVKAQFDETNDFYERNKHDPQFTIPNYTPFVLVDWEMEDGDSGFVIANGEGLENVKVPFDGQDELGSWMNDVFLQEFSKVHEGVA